MNFLIFYFILFASAADYGNFGTYPQVPKTASIDGFADPVFDLMPKCAQDNCLRFGTSNTPCPYWDTGCLCVFISYSGQVAKCIAQNCKGEDVASAVFLATSLCSAVGANTWMMPASISTMLSSAQGNAREVTTIEGKTAASWVSPPKETGSVEASETGESASSATITSSASSSSSTSTATSSRTSSANLAILQTGGIGTIIFGLLMYFVV
ncbi:putative cell surface antigen [Candida maltosa Xu316]|uniref:Putative cell surface antigen n=1 Tax=Candida maltosa (strain Xu316) TaxID=1245528 RepID=M3JX87_CANMX|nr:putative cell surface antigen [Candida maltosa Xu316]